MPGLSLGPNLAGSACLVVFSAAFAYYTAWTLLTVWLAESFRALGSSVAAWSSIPSFAFLLLSLQPFFEPGQPAQQLFPDIYWALVVPVWALLAVVCGVLCYIGLLLISAPSVTSASSALSIKDD